MYSSHSQSPTTNIRQTSTSPSLHQTIASASALPSFLFILFIAATGAKAAAAVGTVDERLSAVASAFDGFAPTVASAEAVAAMQPDWNVAPLRRPSGLSSANYLSVPLMLAPVCLAYNLSRPTMLETSLAALGEALQGASGSMFTNAISSSAVHSSELVFALAAVSAGPASAALLHALNAARVAGAFAFGNASDWPAGIAGNHSGVATTRLYASDAEVVAALARGEANVGLVPVGGPLRLPCVRVRVTSGLTLDSTGFGAAFDELAFRSATVSAAGAEPVTAAIAPGSRYPVGGPLVLSVRRGLDCARGAEVQALAARALAGGALLAPLLSWGFAPLADTDRADALAALLAATCGNVTVVPAGGSSAIASVAARWSLSFLAANPTTFVRYSAISSGAGVAGVKSGAFRLGASDAALTAADRAARPSLAQTPAVGFTVSVVYNLPGVSGLRLGRCAVVGIFTGAIRRWDDARLQATNPSTVLPSLPIAIVARTTKSGTTEIFTAGLRGLQDDGCGSGGGAAVNVTSQWELAVTVATTSTGVMNRAIASVPGAIGYAATPSVGDAGLAEALVVDEASGALTAPQPGYVTGALAAGEVDAATGALAFPRVAGAYPFFGISYFVVDADTSEARNCSSAQAALAWMAWAAGSAGGQADAERASYVPVPEALAELARALVARARCAGALLFPAPAAESGIDVAAAVGGGVAGGVVVIAALAALQAYLVCGRRAGRDLRHAPTDPTKPFTIAFTDIESSTTCWAALPEAMGAALDQHHRIVRECIAAHAGFEIKTIGDSLMVAFVRARDAVAFAVAVQTALYEAEWAPAIDSLYRDLHLASAATLASPAAVAVLSDPAQYAAVWHGLRVRIGVHTAHGDIRLDEVSGSYDYYGTVCNAAARIESVSHGGQVCVSEETFREAFGPAAPLSSPAGALALAPPVATRDLGWQELRGLTEPVRLVQVLPAAGSLGLRAFPPLRLEKAAEVSLEGDDTTDTTKEPSGSDRGGSGWGGSSRGSATSAKAANAVAEEVLAYIDVAAPPQGRLDPAAVLRCFNLLATTFAVLGQRELADVHKALRRGWRLEGDAGRRGARAFEAAVGRGNAFAMALALRVAGPAEQSLGKYRLRGTSRRVFPQFRVGSLGSAREDVTTLHLSANLHVSTFSEGTSPNNAEGDSFSATAVSRIAISADGE